MSEIDLIKEDRDMFRGLSGWVVGITMLLVAALWAITWANTANDLTEMRKEYQENQRITTARVVEIEKYIAVHSEQHKQLFEKLDNIDKRIPGYVVTPTPALPQGRGKTE